MGREFIVSSLEDMCDLMCDNYIPEENADDYCFITGDDCNKEYEDCADCPTFIQETERDTDKDLAWRTATLTELR